MLYQTPQPGGTPGITSSHAKAGQVRRIVQRRKVDAVLNRLFYGIVNNHRLAEVFSAVYDAVPYRANLVHAFDDAVLLV